MTSSDTRLGAGWLCREMPHLFSFTKSFNVFFLAGQTPYQFDINGISIVDPHIADVDGVFLASEQRLKDVSLLGRLNAVYV